MGLRTPIKTDATWDLDVKQAPTKPWRIDDVDASWSDDALVHVGDKWAHFRADSTEDVFGRLAFEFVSSEVAGAPQCGPFRPAFSLKMIFF